MSEIAITNPFVGLRPYEAQESLIFFGRKRQIGELLRRLDSARFLAVVGSSGCGKSSLVRAGLIPILQAGFLVEERDLWLVATMRPGEAPLTHLASGIVDCLNETRQKSGDREDVIDALAVLNNIHERGAWGILQALRRPVIEHDANVLLLVDQFEEVFRYKEKSTGPGWDETSEFVSILIELAAQRDLPIYVIITMRSDFLGDCDTFTGLPEALNRGQYLVPRLSREQRRDAIEGPIRLFKSDISPRLTDRLLNETFDSRDDLPVLQHALRRAWSFYINQGGEMLDVPHYEEIGTVRQALSKHADAALVGMSDRELLLTKRMFQALTTVDATNRAIRRPAHLVDIAARSDASTKEIWDIVQRFRSDGRSFLAVSIENPDADPLIDLSHESLIRQWTLLVHWVDEEQESIKTYLRLAESARLHAAGKSGLYRDPDLQVALDWRRQEVPNAAWASDYPVDFARAIAFLDESNDSRTRWLAEREFDRRMRVLRIGIAMITLFLFVSSFGVPHVKRFWDQSEAICNRLAERGLAGMEKNSRLGSAIGQAAKSASPVQPTVDQQSMALGKVLAELLKIVVHAIFFFAVAYFVKHVYRLYVFRRGIADEAVHASDKRPGYPGSIMKRIRNVLLLGIERISKWLSVIVGFLLLATCSAMAFPVNSLDHAYSVLLACVVPLILIGWVAAVTRINREMKSLNSRLPPPTDVPDKLDALVSQSVAAAEWNAGERERQVPDGKENFVESIPNSKR
ncbi:ATP-binding protein [Paraburkholderia sp. SIMBA_049]